MKKYIWILLFIISVVAWKHFSPPDQALPTPSAVQPLQKMMKVQDFQPSIPTQPNYLHRLTYDPATGTLRGIADIQVWNRASKPTKQVWIQLFLHAFDEGQTPPVLPQFKKKAFPKGVQHGSMVLTQLTVDGLAAVSTREDSILKIDLKQDWSPNSKLQLKLVWQAKIPEIAHRFGRAGHAAWFGNLLPILSVYDGAWHGTQYQAVGDPFFSEAADFTVEIETPLDYQVIATGEEVEVIQDGRKWTRIQAVKVRDFSFAISRDHQLAAAQTLSGKTVNLYFLKTKAKQVQTNLEKAVEMVNYMEQRVAPYPYQEIDIFENEMFVTGMEYPGLVFVLLDRLNEPRGYETVVHEIAHQWFYNLVGSNPLEEPWLDEGWATYFQDEFVYGRQLQEYYREEQQGVSQRFPQTRMGPVNQYQDWLSYWRGNYRKSSLMISSLRQKVGDERFQKLVQEYVQEFQYQILEGEDFMAFAQNYTPEDLTPFFKEWGILK